MSAHLHTVAQALGALLVLLGAWLVAGIGGVVLALGAMVLLGSLLIEATSEREAVPVEQRATPRSHVA